VDAETGREVEPEDIIKGYEVSKGDYIELDPEELEAVARLWNVLGSIGLNRCSPE